MPKTLRVYIAQMVREQRRQKMIEARAIVARHFGAARLWAFYMENDTEARDMAIALRRKLNGETR